ncbi:DUF3659 domain-containing protein [bacterium]|nr:DUF3659 domain-containing protein [bacterium]
MQSCILQLFVLCLLAVPAQLPAQKITDAMNRHVLTVQSDGRILSPQNVTLGHFKPDGRIVDARNRLLGRISKEGRFYSPSNKLLGRIDPDGKVWDAQNVLLGRVEDGRVYDKSNRLIAKGAGVKAKFLGWSLFLGERNDFTK